MPFLILPLLGPAGREAQRLPLALPAWPESLGPPTAAGALAVFAAWAARLSGNKAFVLAGAGEAGAPLRLALNLRPAARWPQALAAAEEALAAARAEPGQEGAAELPPVAFLVAAAGEEPAGCPGAGLEMVYREGGGWSWRRHEAALDAAAAGRLLQLFGIFLAALGASPGAALASLPTLGAAERRRLLELGRGARYPPPARRLLHAAVLEQAARTPQRVAISQGSRCLTYGELAAAAGRLAHHLRALGAGPEMPVGVCLERKPELVASLLGVLAAGGVYLPLDPAYPDARIAFALEDAGASLVVAESSTLARLGDHAARRLVLDGPDAAAIAARPAAPPPELAQPENLAYLIYTSGSTGRAKGVAICHANATEMVAWARRAFGDEESAVVFAATSICFDLSVFELFATLARGGEVVLAERDLFDLPSAPQRERITLLNTVPSVLAELVRAGGLPPALSAVNLAGEPLPGALAAALNRAGVARVRNLYGPSEDTTYSTWTVVPPGDRHPAIGVAVDNTAAYLLDAELGLCPAGLAGELYLAGAGLSRGYLGRPALTAERYLPDPFGEPGGRMYRTGDLARWREDGQLAFLGRLDYQVKIRGFRIELGEVEAALGGVPGVDEAVAMAWPSGEEGETLLVAWVAALETAETEPAALRAALAAQLPAHMVPSHLIRLHSLPRLPNGKIDRKALPPPSRAATRESGYEAPRGATEECLAQIWSAVLGLPEIGRADRLPALGGHSLSAMRIAARVREAFGIALPFAEVAARTLAELAELVAAAASEKLADGLRPGELGDHPAFRPQEFSPSGGAGGEKPAASCAHRPVPGRLAEPPELVAAAASEKLGDGLRPGELGEDPGWEMGAQGGNPPAMGSPPSPSAERGAGGRGPESAAEGETAPLTAPLTAAQRRLIFFDRLYPGHPVYNVSEGLALAGPLDVAALSRALAALAARHPALRTVFRPGPDDETVQQIGGAAVLAPRLVEEAQLAAALAAPYDLAAGPLARALLVRRGEHEHLLALGLHHIVTDGWSMEVLFLELAELYAAALEDPGTEGRALATAAGLPPLAQRPLAGLASPAVATQLDYWRRELHGELPLLELPADRPRPAVASLYGHTVAGRLDAATASRLRQLARRHATTLFGALLAAYAVLLERSSGQTELMVGIPAAGRDDAGLERAVGFFVNLLPLRLDLGGRPSFAGLLERIRGKLLAALANADIPFEKIVEALGVRPERDRHPLFQALFAMETSAFGPPRFKNLETRRERLASGTAKADLVLYADEGAGGEVMLWLEGSSDLFAADTLHRLLARFVAVAGALAAEPARPFAELPLLPPDEAAKVAAFAAPRAAAGGEPVPCQVAARARRQPAAPALRDARGELSYGELLENAARLAHHLRGLGVGPEVGVALLLERSREFAVGALATLLAGGYYIPLDAAHPDERLEFMLAESRAALLLTGAAHTGRVPAFAGLRIPIDEDAPAWASLSAEPPALAGYPAGLAYLIFTSGSTGRPKGVALTHRGLANLVAWHLGEYALEPADRSSWVAGLGFDAAVWELWPPLAAGASLSLPPEALRSDAEGLLGWLAAERISHAFLPTPLAEAVLAELESAPPAAPRPLALRTLLTGGEALRRRPRPAAGFAFFNHYGPTETTVVATAGRVEPAEPADARAAAPPIGRPIAGIAARVLGAELSPVAIGVPGQLYLGGDSLARGYYGRPAATAAAFLPDPFAAAPGSRLYASGDRVRFRDDGSLEFLGRIDDQVKIRGVRIEPGEIEAALALQPAVRQAAVRVFAGKSGPRLVGYAAVDPGAGVTAEDLRRHLAGRLPAAMVPETLVILPALPLTPNGKVDRKALAEPTLAPPADAEGPRTAAEERVAAVWSELLGVPVTSRRDSFFELGGHSLLAARAVARLGRAFGVALGVAELFAAPRLADFAHRLVRAQQKAGDGILPELTAEAGPQAGLPLSSSQERLYFLARLAPESPFYNVPEVLDLAGRLDAEALAAALAAVLDRHRALWARFRLAGGRPLQDLDRRPSLALRRDDLAELPAAEAERAREAITAEEIGLPFDLAEGPLARARLIALGPERHRLVLTFHHLVFDGWSADVLLDDLAAAYLAITASGAPPAPLPFGWPDYLRWQQQRRGGGELDGGLEYWKDLLSGAPPALELPADRPRPAAQRFRGGVVPLHFPPAAAQPLAALGQAAGATLFMTLLALYGALLHRLSGQHDLVVGVPFAGRDAEELENQVGFFVNTLPLRLDLAGGPSFKQLLERVRTAALLAFAHPDVPFDRLVEQLGGAGGARDFSRSPVFQVIFVSPQPRPALVLGELAARRVPVHTGSAKFDLSLFLGRDGDGGLEGFFEYDSDLFDRSTIERFAGHLDRLLAAAAATPDLPIGRLPMLQAGEEEHLRRLQAAAGTTGPDDACLHQLILRQAELTPEAPALVHRGETITYRQLIARAGRLAARLRALGAGPEERVGVCLPRTADLPLALLATLLAGAAYLPLDPAYPDERLAFMQEDARAVVTITTRALAPRLGAGAFLLLDAPADAAVPPEPAAGPAAEPAVLPQNLAYLIYTSGSTGRAKGVAIEHRQAVALMRWARGVFGEGELAGTVAATSVCFDLSVFEIFLPLTVGGAVIVVDNALDLASARLGPVAPTLVNTVPSAMAEALRMGSLPPTVATVCLAGEPLPGSLAAGLHAAGVARVYNLYGPSEDTTYSTVELVPPGDPAPSIGVPIAGTTAQVLDPELQPLPAGVPGELFLGGEGVARGYLGRPSLTAERFLPDPFAAAPGRRLYRTGDRVRRGGDDRLAYLGRTDHQVKIRGFRIEPGEIEVAIAAHPAIESAVVATHRSGDDLRLVAWAERKEGAPGSDGDLAAALRAHLASRLPGHMVPSGIAVLERLPRLPNGKVDRKALPAVTPAASATVAPRSPLETVLAGLWAEALGLPEVGVEDDFFLLGGHSLLAVRLLGRVEEELLLAAPPPLAAFFGARTVAALAELLLAREDRRRLERTAELLTEMHLLSDDEIAARMAAEE